MPQQIQIKKGLAVPMNKPLKKSQNPYNLLKIEENNENVGNFNVEVTNKKGRKIVIHCDNPLIKKLHPVCIKNNNINKVEKERERKERIRFFLQKYFNEVGNPKNNPTYQSDYVRFVKSIRNKPEERWLYESYIYATKNKNITQENEPEYLYNKNKQTKTQRQRTHLRSIFSGLKKNIEDAYRNPEENRIYMSNIHNLFESLHLESKIKFHFNFEKIKLKIKSMKKFMSRLRFYNFINSDMTHQMIHGEKFLNEIFEDTSRTDLNILTFLSDHQILNDAFVYEYYLQFTHSYREAARFALIEWVNMYRNRINLIYSLLKQINISKELIVNMFIQSMIIEPIKKYLFNINYGFIHFFDKKEEILELCFEDFYYFHLKQNIIFILSFFECEDSTELPSETMNEGAVGNIYDMRDGSIAKMMKGKVVYEKIFFEFFKQCCVHHLFPQFTLPSYELFLGPNMSYIRMQKYGINYLNYYQKWIHDNKSDPNFENMKKNKILGFLNKVGQIIQQYQSIQFLHRDLNPRNILISEDGNENNLKFIDFDYSVINIHNLLILNYRKDVGFENIFEKRESNGLIHIGITDFGKSIDLFRIVIHFFFVYDYTKHFNPSSVSNHNRDSLNTQLSLLNQLRILFFGTDNEEIPNNFSIYFGRNNNPIRRYKRFRYLVFANNFMPRKYIFEQFFPHFEETHNTTWIEKFKYWEKPFIPEQFLAILQSIHLNGGSRKKSLKNKK